MSDYGADPDPDENKIRQVAFGYRLAPHNKLKVDQHSAPDAEKTYHLVERIGSTNLLILVDPALLPSL